MSNAMKLEALQPREREWLRQKLDSVNTYISSLLPEFSGAKIDAGLLDRLWTAWMAAEPDDNETTANFLQAFGVAFGQLLVDEIGFEWAIFTDESGTGIAVHAPSATSNTCIVPIDFVLTQYENGENAFVAQTYQEIGRIVMDENKDNTSERYGGLN